MALYDGQAYVSPEHVQELAVPVIAHRLALDPQARFSGATATSVVVRQPAPQDTKHDNS